MRDGWCNGEAQQGPEAEQQSDRELLRALSGDVHAEKDAECSDVEEDRPPARDVAAEIGAQ